MLFCDLIYVHLSLKLTSVVVKYVLWGNLWGLSPFLAGQWLSMVVFMVRFVTQCLRLAGHECQWDIGSDGFIARYMGIFMGVISHPRLAFLWHLLNPGYLAIFFFDCWMLKQVWHLSVKIIAVQSKILLVETCTPGLSPVLYHAERGRWLCVYLPGEERPCLHFSKISDKTPEPLVSLLSISYCDVVDVSTW